MKTKDAELREKEQTEKLKALRKELEEKLEEQLPAEFLTEQSNVEIQKIDLAEEMDAERAKQVVEALLFASSKPLTVAEIRKAVPRFSAREIEGWIQEFKESYGSSSRSFEIVEIAGGYEFSTKKDFAPWILKMELQKKARQATQSALETLAILAYKQPVTRAEIEELRGVDVSGVLNTLVSRGFARISGKKEVPGRPFLYVTTDKFLEHFGLKSIEDLPPIEEIKAIVDNAVRKEELIGTTKMVEVPASEENGNESRTDSQEN